jgi:hypothetical protein
VLPMHLSRAGRTVTLVRFQWHFNFFTYFPKLLKYQISLQSVQMEPSCSMRRNGRTDRHEEADSRFPPISRTRAINTRHRKFGRYSTMTDRDKMHPRKTSIKALFGEFCMRPER